MRKKEISYPGNQAMMASRFSALFLLIVILGSCHSSENAKESTADTGPAKFVGSAQCQSCHTKVFADWQRSDHFRAMQEPRDSTVLGDFNDQTFRADGVTSRFFKRDGTFYIQTQGDDGNNHDYAVRYTFGYYPLQQYLIEFPNGRLQPARVSWDSKNKKWFHQYAGQRIPAHDWLHWTGNGQNWNTMCATCHSTNLKKNYDFLSDTYNTTWTDINVGCESCHGPGSRHIDFLKSDAYANGERIPNSGLAYAGDTLPRMQVNTCAPCHARKADLTADLPQTDQLLDVMVPQVLSSEFYFADGQIREEDYEYGSFAQSKMYHLGVRCSNCHNPHSGKLVKTGNDLCMSCHLPKYNTSEHHFHKVNTEASQCISCHMTSKTYMGNDVRRDHSFRIPRPDQSLAFGTPNACNGCHTDKPASWASQAVSKWHGPQRAHHFSDDLLPGGKLDEKSEPHLIALLRDRMQPAIARATAAFYLGSLGTSGSSQALTGALHDDQAIVRYYSLRSLLRFPPTVWLQPAGNLLRDQVKAVRIAAADLFHQVPQENIPTAWLPAFRQADEENRKYLSYQTDFAVGNVMLADYELQSADYVNAIKHYVRGLDKDSLMNYARLNLSSAYNATGQNESALTVLNDAASVDPTNDRIYYNLGLLQFEMSNVPSAVENFKKALKLNSRMPGLYYNYGLLLQQQGKLKEAEEILLKGIHIEPGSISLNYALAVFYVQQGKPAAAMPYARNLRQLDPSNPNYQQLFQSLGV